MGLWGNELSEGNELVGNDLDTNELADDEEIILADTEEPCDWVEEVAEDELDGQVVCVGQVVWWLWGTDTGPDVDVLAEPGEDAVDHGEHGENDEEGGGNHTSHLKTEPSTHSEGVEGVLWLLLGLVTLWDDHAARGEGLLGFWVAELGDGEGGWDGHDAGGDQSLWVDTHTDVGGEDGTGNGSETRGHDLVDFGIGQVWNERLDKHDRLSLSDERRGSSDDGLSSGNAHGPEEDDGELSNEKLEPSVVVEELDEGDEEDNRWEDIENPPVESKGLSVQQELSSGSSEMQEGRREESNEVEDIVLLLRISANSRMYLCEHRKWEKNLHRHQCGARKEPE